MIRLTSSVAVTFAAMLTPPLSGQQWSQASSGPRPSARFGTVMTMAPAGDAVVLVGGGPSPFNPLGETWEFDGAAWTRLTGVTTPRRLSHAMATDTDRGRIVLFGGIGPSLEWRDDTYEWDGTAWMLRQSTRQPPALAFHAMAYDRARKVTVLYGGNRSALPSATDQTWEWDGSDWTRVVTSRNPGRLREMLLAYSPAMGGVVLHGGQGSGTGAPQPNATWRFDGRDWVELSLSSPGRPVIATRMVEDRDTGGLLFFGGFADFVGSPDETWRLDPVRGWERYRPPMSPSPRGDLTAAWLPGVGMVVFGGGLVPAPPNNETWVFGGDGASVATFGTACAGAAGLPLLTPESGSVPSLGAVFTMRADGLGPAVRAASMILAATAADPPVGLGAFGLPGCRAFAPLAAGSVWLPVVAAAGTARWDLPVPIDPALAGAALFEQAVAVDSGAPHPTKLSLSNAAVLRIGS
ncbi:MAG: hypothetical protein AAF628_13110 [Planctomycetota bacterium]